MDELELKQQEIRRLKTERNFNKAHSARGGINELMKMVQGYRTLDRMSGHFGLSRQRMSQIVGVLLGMSYADYLARHGEGRQSITVNK